MPHVDDGTLHALLDGALRADDPEAAAAAEAHLADCEDCRARLESAAGMRERASGILADAAPVAPGATPDFEEVRARARASDTAPSTIPGGIRRHAPAVHRQARWTRGIAWAASLVLALGTGYLLRDLVDVPMAGDQVEAPAASPTPTSEASERSTERPQEQPQERPQEPAADRTADAERAPVRQDVSAPPPVAPAGGEASQREEGPARSLLESPAPSPSEGAAMDAASPALPSARASGSVVGAQWSVATLAEARAALDGPVYRLPRAEITAIYIESIGDSDARPRVMTMQRLETGIPLQVVQGWGESAARPGEADAPREADDAEVGSLPQPEVARATRGDYVLEVTGSLPEELLEILAESATPAT